MDLFEFKFIFLILTNFALIFKGDEQHIMKDWINIVMSNMIYKLILKVLDKVLICFEKVCIDSRVNFYIR